ncbi:MAG: hypothetical protein V7706_18570 [Dietzia psychralcaliphila]
MLVTPICDGLLSPRLRTGGAARVALSNPTDVTGTDEQHPAA